MIKVWRAHAPDSASMRNPAGQRRLPWERQRSRCWPAARRSPGRTAARPAPPPSRAPRCSPPASATHSGSATCAFASAPRSGPSPSRCPLAEGRRRPQLPHHPGAQGEAQRFRGADRQVEARPARGAAFSARAAPLVIDAKGRRSLHPLPRPLSRRLLGAHAPLRGRRRRLDFARRPAARRARTPRTPTAATSSTPPCASTPSPAITSRWPTPRSRRGAG